jgi:outer membrane autotransporter protein
MRLFNVACDRAVTLAATLLRRAKTAQTHRRLITMAALAAGALSGMATGAMAQTTWINPGAGDWFTAGNWTAGVPTSATTGTFINNGGTAQISAGNANAGAGTSGQGPNNISLTIGGGSLASTLELLGGAGLDFHRMEIATNGTFAPSNDNWGHACAPEPCILLSGGTLLANSAGGNVYWNGFSMAEGTTSTLAAVNTLALSPTANGGNPAGYHYDFGDGSVLQFGGPGIITYSGGAQVTSSGMTGIVVLTGGTLQATSVQLGSGGGIGQLTGVVSTTTVQNGGTLDFNDISGTINNLLGAGTVKTGANGTTLISLGQGNFSGNITGAGGLRQLGGGVTTLSGASDYTGPTTIDATGTLIVNGSIVSPTTANNGATLMGTGQLGATTILGGALYAPGNYDIGTQTVIGNFTLGAGAIYEAEVNAAGQGDKVIVNGAVDLTGSVLHVLARAGNYQPSTQYIIVDNDGIDAVTGTFASVMDNLVFLTPTVIYNGGTGNDVVLTLERNATLFTSVADTRNQRAVAGALDRFPTNNPLFLTMLNQTADGARQAFDALSGEIHATVAGLIADDSRYVREAILGRLMQATYTNKSAPLGAGRHNLASLDAAAMALGYDDKSFSPVPPSLAFWTRGYGAWGDFDGNRNAADASRDLGGFVSGMDARIGGTWRAGLGAGYSQSNVSVADRHSNAEVESFHLAGYTGGMAGPFALRGGGAWTWNDIDTSRVVIFPGFFEREKSRSDADTAQLFGEAAYPIAMGRTAVEPFAGLAFVSIDTDDFRENGAEAALNSRGFDQDVGYSTLGLRAAVTMAWNSVTVTPHVSAAWQHAFDDVTPGAALAFASTGIGFDVTGVPLAEDTALIEAGLDLSLGPTTTAGVSYSGQFGDGVADNAVKGRVTWLF